MPENKNPSTAPKRIRTAKHNEIKHFLLEDFIREHQKTRKMKFGIFTFSRDPAKFKPWYE